MSGYAAVTTGCPREIRALLFTVMGVRFAVDADQVAEMLDIETARARGLAVQPFHEKVRFRGVPGAYRAPKVLIIKGASCGIVIDEPDDISAISVNAIQPMPALLRGRAGCRAVWGAVVTGQQAVVLLVDLHTLPNEAVRPHPEAS